MGKILIVAEKPSVAREIAEALGGFAKVEGWLESPSAVISSGIGHLVEIHAPEAATTGRDLASLPVIPARFELRPIEKTKAQFNLLSKLMRRADIDQVVNACDAGREGELIFRLIYEHAGCRKPMKRMWLQSMTMDAIRDAYRSMRSGGEYDALSDAAKCRSEADWLVGINGSRGVTRLRERQTQSYEMMTAGRVQTPTLAILVHREQEIKHFVPKDFWEVHATFGAQAGTYEGKWFSASAPAEGEDAGSTGSRFWDRAQAEAIVAKCRGVAPSSVKDDSKTTSSAPPKLFDLTSLQREANKKFKFSAKKTLDIAQALYEKHKATTYPRTDATALPEDYVAKTKEILGTFGGTQYAEHAARVLENSWVQQEKRIFDNSKISDHFAIIPTGTRPSGLDDSEAKIYDMVVRRFVAAFHPAAEHNLTTRSTVVAGETFKSSGKVLVKRGWLEVYGQQASDDKTPALCAVAPGEAVRTDRVEAVAMQTTPPARFTEDTLLSAMEGAGKLVDDDELRDAMKERGLGTPATRASIIEGLLADKDSQGRHKEPYAVREGKAQHLVPTQKGMGLIQFLDSNGIESLTSPKMTGEWEQKLRQIEKGQYRREAFMAEIAAMTRNIIDVIRQKAGEMPAPQERVLGVPCPKCGSDVLSHQRTFECKTGCGFKFWREIAGRDLSDAEAERLFRDGEIKQLDGFVSKQKRKFSAGLKLNAEHKAEFVFEDKPAGGGAGQPSGQAAPDLGVPCPKCGGAVRVRGGDYPQYVCDKGDFKLWKVISGRPLSDAEAATLIRQGELPAVHGFVSTRTKNKFSAGLRLSADKSKADFVFEPK
ncbi:MAG: DNA topoisomerase 3 [Propionivibrio sp.]|nr:DNA topoisomerase 3 [Propionivibrio sp.]